MRQQRLINLSDFKQLSFFKYDELTTSFRRKQIPNMIAVHDVHNKGSNLMVSITLVIYTFQTIPLRHL